MINSRDRLFYLLFSIEDNKLSVGRLNCYMYIFQLLGVNLDYKFRINTSGLRSKNFSRFLEDQIAKGVVCQKDGYIAITNDSESLVDNYIMSFRDIRITNYVKSILSDLSDDELYLVCIVSIIMNDVISSRGIDALVTSRNFIENSVKNLCSAYSSDNFNYSIAFLRKLEKECRLDV